MFDQQLRFAIAHKRLVRVRYHGSTRIAEPHDYGRHHGVDKLFAWQVRNETQPGGAGQWRLLEIAQIEELHVLDETFSGSRGQSHQRHRVWDAIYARVG
jgi:hypothetical protein